jgi:hypothetical protein
LANRRRRRRLSQAQWANRQATARPPMGQLSYRALGRKPPPPPPLLLSSSYRLDSYRAVRGTRTVKRARDTIIKGGGAPYRGNRDTSSLLRRAMPSRLSASYARSLARRSRSVLPSPTVKGTLRLAAGCKPRPDRKPRDGGSSGRKRAFIPWCK